LIAKATTVPETIKDDKTEDRFRFPNLRWISDSELAKNENAVMKRLQQYLIFLEKIIKKNHTRNKMLKFDVKIKQRRITMAERDVREREVTIQKLKTLLDENNKEPKDKNKAESDRENNTGINPPELMYEHKDMTSYNGDWESIKLDWLKLKRIRALELENKRTATSSPHPSPEFLLKNIPQSLQTIEKQHKDNKMLKFYLKIKERRMTIAELAARERVVTIEKLKTQIDENNKDPKDKNKTESEGENNTRIIPPELMYEYKDKNQTEEMEITPSTSSPRPSSEFLPKNIPQSLQSENHLSRYNGTQPLTTSSTPGKQ
jgi:hypothetical protein